MKKIRTSLEITKLLIFFELFSVWSSIKTWFLEMVYLWTGRMLSDNEKENELIQKMVQMVQAASGEE